MMETILLVISVALLLCWLAYQKLTSKWGIFAERGVPFNKPRLVLGNFELTNNFVNTIQDVYDKYRDEKVTGFFTFVTPAFLVKDVDLIKQITIKDFDSFVNHDKMFDENIDRIFGRSLVLMRDEKWRVMRTTLSPLFTSSKMKMMFGMVSECSHDFVAHFEKKAKEGKVIIDAKDTFARYTVDGISTAALGFKGDCIENEDSSLFKMAIGFSKPNLKSKIKMMMAIMARPLYELLGLQLFTGEVRSFFHRAIVDVMHEREAKNIFRPDIIQLLIQTKKGQIEAREKDDGMDLQNFSANIEYDVGVKNRKVIEWTDDDFIAQGFIFFGAGFDSTSNLLQFMSYELAKSSEVQAELIEEVDEVVAVSNGKPVSYEALHKMKFLDQVVSEVLRLSPPGPFATRECNKDYKINLGNGREVLIKKGENVLIPIMAIHRDSKYYENPETFDPRRFDDDKKDSIVPGSFIPFGSGPRTCIGSRFALMVAKLLIFNILCKFTIEVCDKTPDKIEATATFGVAELKKEIFVEFKPRQQDR